MRKKNWNVKKVSALEGGGFMKKIAAISAAIVLMVVSTTGAFAATPANQACFGEDFSGYAKAFRPLGQVLTNFEVGGTPIIEGGLGDEVQNHLAGNVPDGVIPNSCND